MSTLINRNRFRVQVKPLNSMRSKSSSLNYPYLRSYFYPPIKSQIRSPPTVWSTITNHNSKTSSLTLFHPSRQMFSRKSITRVHPSLHAASQYNPFGPQRKKTAACACVLSSSTPDSPKHASRILRRPVLVVSLSLSSRISSNTLGKEAAV